MLSHRLRAPTSVAAPRRDRRRRRQILPPRCSSRCSLLRRGRHLLVLQLQRQRVAVIRTRPRGGSAREEKKIANCCQQHLYHRRVKQRRRRRRPTSHRTTMAGRSNLRSTRRVFISSRLFRARQKQQGEDSGRSATKMAPTSTTTIGIEVTVLEATAFQEGGGET